MLQPLATRALVAVASRVPLDLVGPLSQAVGTIAFLASPRARGAVRANQLVIAPRRRPRVRHTFVAQVRGYIEIFRLLRASSEQVRERVQPVHWERFIEAYAQGRGVIMASAHFGPVSICGQIFPAMGYAVTMPVEDERSDLAREINRARRAFGGTMVGTSSARTAYKVLRQGGILGSMTDRAVTGTGERIELFGRPVLLPSAHVVLALRSNAALVPAFAYRDGTKAKLVFEPELELPRTGDHGADVLEGMRRFARILERHLSQRPEEWTVFENVFARDG